MAFLEDKGVAAGTSASTVDIFKVSALELHGPRDPFQKLQKQLLSNDGAKHNAFGKSARPFVSIGIHGVPNQMFVHQDVQLKPSWFVGASVFQPTPCEPSTHKFNETYCTPCLPSIFMEA